MRPRHALILCLYLLASLVPAPSRAESSDLSRSVVKIFTVTNRPNYYQPWVLGYQYNASGSGCVLPGHRVLTNAHVVSDQVFLQVMKAGDTKKYTARVAYVDHDREVAILRVKDPEFFEGTKAVQFGDLPGQRDKVAVYGFPIGGDELSITEGVVSRIEVQRYVHSQRSFLTVQTDAAINPGNSGGPAFKGGKMIGIAFQAFSGAEAQNTGYIVPVPVIQRSLKDLSDGEQRGAPGLGLAWQKMENPALRAYYGMRKDQTGVLVTRVVYGSPAWGKVKTQDVVTSVGGVPIADNGTVTFRSGERLHFSYIVGQYEMGQSLRLGILRKGKPMELGLELKPYQSLVPGPSYDVKPSYFIFAGLVFMPLTADYLGLWKNGTAPSMMADLSENGLPTKSRRRVVFINEVLPHDINVGYHSLKQAVVVKVNGRSVSDLRDVVEAFKHPSGKFHVVELDHSAGDGDNFGDWVILDAEGAEKATKEILRSFGIPKDRSEDLEAALKEGSPVKNEAGADD